MSWIKPPMPNGVWMRQDQFEPLSENAPGQYWVAWNDMGGCDLARFSNLDWLFIDAPHRMRTPDYMMRIEYPGEPDRDALMRGDA